MEIWDGYSENEEKLGIDLVRGEEKDRGVFHVVVQVIVTHADGTFLLMQRDFNKSMYGGLWETGASGSLLKGESFVEGAKRELLEETGISSNELILVDTIINKENQTIYKVFSCNTDKNKNEIILQHGETISFRWISKEELLGFIETDDFVTPSLEAFKNIIKK